MILSGPKWDSQCARSLLTFIAFLAGIEYCRDHEIRILCQCECQDGLGMADGRIPDESISASSATAPVFGRLGSSSEWIPDRDPTADLSEEWLQVSRFGGGGRGDRVLGGKMEESSSDSRGFIE